MEEGLFLSDVESSNEFRLASGKNIKNVYELASDLKAMDDKTFSYYCNSEKDDFANWIGDVLKDRVIAEHLKRVKNRRLYIKILEKAIEHLEFRHEANSSTIRVSKLWLENNRRQLIELRNNLKAFEQSLTQKQKGLDTLISKTVESEIDKLILKKKTNFKSELEKTMNINSELEKRFNDSIKEKEKQLEDYIIKNASSAIEKHLRPTIDKQKNILEVESAKAEQKTEDIIQNFHRIIDEEKASAKAIIAKSLDNEFAKGLVKNKLLIDDELTKISKSADESGKKISNTSVIAENRISKSIIDAEDRILKLGADAENKISKTTIETENKLNKLIGETQARLHDELDGKIHEKFSSTISRHRELLDAELSKTLQSNKEFASRYEKEVMQLEKKLQDNINKTIEKRMASFLAGNADMYRKELEKEFLNIKQMISASEKAFAINSQEKIRQMMDKASSDHEDYIKDLYSKEQSNLVLKSKELLNALEDKLKAFEKILKEKEQHHEKTAQSTMQVINEHISKELSLKMESANQLFDKNVQAAVDKSMNAALARYKEKLNDEYKLIIDKLNDSQKSLDIESKEKQKSLIQDITESMIGKVSANMDAELAKLNEKLQRSSKSISENESRYNSLVSEKSSQLDKQASMIIENNMQQNLSKYKDVLYDESKKASQGIIDLGKIMEKSALSRQKEILDNLDNAIADDIKNKADIILSNKLDAINSNASKIIESIKFQKKELDEFIKSENSKIDEVIKSEKSNMHDIIKIEKGKIDDAIKSEKSKIEDMIRFKIDKELESRFSNIMDKQKKLFENKISRARELAEEHNQRLAKDLKESGSKSSTDAISSVEQRIENMAARQKMIIEQELSKISKFHDMFDKLKSDYNNKALELEAMTKNMNALLKDAGEIKLLRKQAAKDNIRMTNQMEMHDNAVAELHRSKLEFEKEKSELQSSHAKLIIYELINKCRSYIQGNDMHNVRKTYDLLTRLYKNTPLSKDEKQDIYRSILVLHKDIGSMIHT